MADAFYTRRPLPAESTYFVSKATSASDSNDGLTVNSAKATIAGALTALGSSGGLIQVGAGTFTISAADGNGNAVTLANAGMVLRGLGRSATRIVLGGSVSVTWGILAQKALCEVQDIGFQVPAGTSCSFGMGVDTPASPGSAENCKFVRCLVQGTGGTLTNGYAIAQAWSGGGVDIAGTLFFSCRAVGYVNAGYVLGNSGTTGNVLDTDIFDCSAQAGAFALVATDTNFHWVGGTLGENTTADFSISASTSAASVVEGVRSENSARLLQSSSATTNSLVAFRDVSWVSSSSLIAAAGDVINHSMSGSLVLDNVAIGGNGTVTPVIILAAGTGGRLTVTATGLQTSQPLHQLFSATPSQNVQVIATNYTQLSSTGATPVVTTVPGPLSLFGTGTSVNFNGSSRDVMSPVETQTLASSGAVTINGTANYAKITLQANATSSSVTNLYPGQRLTISWVQDATGGRTYVWPTICKFAGGVTPPASTAANAIDSVTFYYDGTSLIQANPLAAVSVIDGVAVSGTPSVGQSITATSGTAANWQTPAGGVTLDTTASDIAALGTRAAGATGQAADAGHVHPTTGVALANDPLQLGQAVTYNWLVNAQNSLTTGNSGYYMRLMAGGYAISNLSFFPFASSGNISVAVYSTSGTGASAKPTGGQLATSGAVACPASGSVATVSLGSTVTPNLADWAAISSDNATTSFTAIGAGTGNSLMNGMGYVQGTAHPLPATPSLGTGGNNRHYLMKGS